MFFLHYNNPDMIAYSENNNSSKGTGKKKHMLGERQMATDATAMNGERTDRPVLFFSPFF